MKNRFRLSLAFAGIALLLVAIIAGSAYLGRKQRPFQNAPRLISALEAFSRDQSAHGRSLPAEVSLQDLIRGGYVTANDVAGLEGMQVTLSTKSDDAQVQRVLARARTPDGQFICLLADGSVQQLSRSRFEETFGNSSQAGATNKVQSPGADSNLTPSAVASGQ